MKALRYIKKISRRMFYRVFLTYSLIIFLTMSALFVFLSEYYSDFIVQRELDRHETLINEIKSELQEKHQFVNQGIRQLYLEERLIEDLAFALQHDYQEYIGYRLDKFSSSDSFVPYNFDIYVKNYFSRDPEAIALQIRNENLGTEYVYLYDHSRWNQSNHYKEDHATEFDTYNSAPVETYQPPKDMFIVEEQINDPVSMDRLGKVMVYFSYENINRLLSLRDTPAQGTIFITDEQGNLYYSYGSVSESLIDELNYTVVQKQVKRDDRYYIQSSIDPASQLMVTAVIPEKEIAQLLTYKTTIFSIILVLTVVAIALPYFSLRGYSKRVDEILTKMRDVQNGNLTARIHATKVDDDLTIISHTFNETLDELNNYINKVYFSKLKQTEAELANLQAQINPHFLYNTLEAIRMKSLAEGGRTSAKMIVQLAELFRYSLKSADVVTVEEEMKHALQYIELFKIRFKNQLNSHFEVDEKYYSYYLPPFILQPLIENFLLHGFKRGSEVNQVNVTIYEKENSLKIDIEDNGSGIEGDRLNGIKERLKRGEGSENSIGLGNVNQRIRLKYGEQYGVSITSTPNVKTTVSVMLPLIRGVD
ncbi:sensor histidine kinase [Jeotgalibacillus proteolyticus]|uniref:sensor histidine kinase n=1 Tax=Jeotgalibacillus proteolyticus TaxID=2082395 RepID=UPI001430146F|nr:sensor histidine kinase [Jeotgalibacillus proteolyticus]